MCKKQKNFSCGLGWKGFLVFIFLTLISVNLFSQEFIEYPNEFIPSFHFGFDANTSEILTLPALSIIHFVSEYAGFGAMTAVAYKKDLIDYFIGPSAVILFRERSEGAQPYFRVAGGIGFEMEMIDDDADYTAETGLITAIGVRAKASEHFALYGEVSFAAFLSNSGDHSTKMFLSESIGLAFIF